MRISDWSSDVCSSDLEAGILSLLSAYRAERSYNSEDIDRTAASLFAYSASQKTWATSQELRFVSADEGPFSAGGRLHWSAGLYWFHEHGWRDQNALANVCTPTNRAANQIRRPPCRAPARHYVSIPVLPVT